jgi:hypothetical protein
MMRLKDATMFALIGVTLLTVLLATDFVVTVMNSAVNVVAPLTLLTSAIHLLAGVSVAVFLWVFYKSR